MKNGIIVALIVLIFLPEYTSAQAIDSAIIKIDTVVAEFDSMIDKPDLPQGKQYRYPGESMKGIIIPDYEDSTILQLLYGIYSKDTGGLYYFNAGPWPFDDRDSIIMRTDQQYEDDSTVVIYVRGQETATAANHDMYLEDALILHRVDNGWQVADSYEDGHSPDFHFLYYLGTYGHGHYLMRREYGGVYGGGHYYEEFEYFMISRDSLNGPRIYLEMASADGASGRCDSARFGGSHDPDCGCHRDKGTSTYGYDSILDCIVIRFQNSSTQYECMQTNPVTTRTTQVWYMTEDTALLAVDIDSVAKGEDLQDNKLLWKKGPKNALHLSRTRIEKALAKNGRRRKYGFAFSPYAITSAFDQ